MTLRATPYVALTALAVLAPKGEEPIVFLRTGGRLDRCQKNGCSGGWCNTRTKDCEKPPASCR